MYTMGSWGYQAFTNQWGTTHISYISEAQMQLPRTPKGQRGIITFFIIFLFWTFIGIPPKQLCRTTYRFHRLWSLVTFDRKIQAYAWRHCALQPCETSVVHSLALEADPPPTRNSSLRNNLNPWRRSWLHHHWYQEQPSLLRKTTERARGKGREMIS